MSNRDYLVDIINKQLRHCDLADCRKCSYGGNSCNQAEVIADRLMEAGYPWPQWISVKDGLPDPPPPLERETKEPGTNHERYIADYVRDVSVEEIAALFAGVASSVAENLHVPNEEDFYLGFETFLRTPEKTLLEEMREVSNARMH